MVKSKKAGEPSPKLTHAAPVETSRKPWRKKTPVEVVLEQADKLRKEIEEAEQDLALKRKQLQKFEEARKIFEAS